MSKEQKKKQSTKKEGERNSKKMNKYWPLKCKKPLPCLEFS
jgi:hypothetical protein